MGQSSASESPKNMFNYHEVVSTMQNLSDKVLEVLKDNRMCITLGGDHSVGFGKFCRIGTHNIKKNRYKLKKICFFF